MRPVLAEVTRWKSIGDALAPTDSSVLSTDTFYSKRENKKAYSPTTCLAAGAERGVCFLRNITGDSSRGALLQ